MSSLTHTTDNTQPDPTPHIFTATRHLEWSADQWLVLLDGAVVDIAGSRDEAIARGEAIANQQRGSAQPIDLEVTRDDPAYQW